MKHFKTRLALLAIIFTIGSSFTTKKAMHLFESTGYFTYNGTGSEADISSYESVKVYTLGEITSLVCPDDYGIFCGGALSYRVVGSTIYLDDVVEGTFLYLNV